jgi:hypothetical protein
MSRDRINRLSRRVEALGQCASPKRRRVFKVVVDNHMKQDEEIARYRAEHGLTDNDDLLIARIVIPFEQRPGETATEAYQRELAGMANK